MLLTIQTTAASAATARRSGTSNQLWYSAGFSAVGIVLAFGGLKQRYCRGKTWAMALIILSTLLGAFSACGGGGSGVSGGAGHPGTPPNSYPPITVNATVGTITRSTQVALTVQ